ncbi:thiamine diphosphokinase [Roseivivax sp. CAU 1761]
MKTPIVSSTSTVLLVGGAPCASGPLKRALARTDCAVAADGGAATLLALGRMPDAVIGDLDSLPEDLRARIPPARLHRIAEQDSTDFDKALRNIAAPLILGFGFLEARLDHALAALTVLARRPGQRCLLIGAADAVALVPPELTLDLAPGTRVSLYPLCEISGRSEGLRWPIDGLRLAPGGRIGTSNEALGQVRLRPGAPGLVVLVPGDAAGRLEAGLRAAPPWPEAASG